MEIVTGDRQRARGLSVLRETSPQFLPGPAALSGLWGVAIDTSGFQPHMSLGPPAAGAVGMTLKADYTRALAGAGFDRSCNRPTADPADRIVSARLNCGVFPTAHPGGCGDHCGVISLCLRSSLE